MVPGGAASEPLSEPPSVVDVGTSEGEEEHPSKALTDAASENVTMTPSENLR
jgi:hypothetical protein